MIVRLQNDDAQAWAEMVELFAPLIFHWCHKCGLSESDSADLMQEVFGVVARKVASYRKRPGATFRGWLWTVTQNKIRDFCRRNKHVAQAIGGTQAQMQLAELADSFDDDSHLDLTSESCQPELGPPGTGIDSARFPGKYLASLLALSHRRPRHPLDRSRAENESQ